MSFEELVTDLLRRSPTHSLSLAELANRLRGEPGGALGNYHELFMRLKRSPARFYVHARTEPFGQGGFWSGDVREAYVSALDRAGVDRTPIVTLLTDDPDRDDVISAMRATLVRVAPALEGDPAVKEDLLAVLGGESAG